MTPGFKNEARDRSSNPILSMTDPESLKTRFKELVEREDAPGLLALLGTHQQVRGLIDEPLFSFGKPAVVCARNNLPLLDVLLEFGANINARSQWEPGSYGPQHLGGSGEYEVEVPASAPKLRGALPPATHPDAITHTHE